LKIWNVTNYSVIDKIVKILLKQYTKPCTRI